MTVPTTRPRREHRSLAATLVALVVILSVTGASCGTEAEPSTSSIPGVPSPGGSDVSTTSDPGPGATAAPNPNANPASTP